MVAYLTKSDASEGFNQVIDFLNGSYIKYALTVNPNIYVSCIKQFWNTVAIKQVNDVTRLQALVDKKKVVVTETAIREDKRLRRKEMKMSMLKMLLLVMMLKKMILLLMEKFLLSLKNHPYHLLLHLPHNHNHLKISHQHPRRVEHLKYDKVAQALEITKLKRRVKKLEKGNRVKVLKLRRLKRIGTLQRIDTFDDTVMDDESNQGRIIDKMDKDDDVALMDDEEKDKKDEEAKVVDNDQVQGRQAESQAKIYKIDMDDASKVLSMQEDEPAEVQEVVYVVTTAKLITEVVTAASETVTAASTIIFAVEPQVPAATITAAPAKEPKPLKKKQQVEMDEEYARKLHDELNKDINWDVAIDHVKLKAKEDSAVQKYQAIKRKPQTEAQAQKNMMMYLKNAVGFRLDYFKGMSYDDIQRAAKRRKLDEEVKDLKRHLEIVPDKDDDVYTEATPLARKVPVVDYEIIEINNKPYYKIIRADGTHQLYISFLTLLKNFDREDLEALWSLVKERFSTSKPKNFSDDFLLTTLGAMFEKPDVQAQVWKNQKTIHGQAKVKSWKLLESCGVYIITFSTTQLILLVERSYPLSRFTLDQMLNAVRLRVEEESEVSLELLRFTRQQHQEGQLE
nr:hypothetical protein [Tanacetum cinerariifolium]